jgi:hypothetical protein
MGGVLANPASKWPDTLGKIDFLRKYPYFLPCAVAASVAFSGFAIAFVGLREVHIPLSYFFIHGPIPHQSLPSAVARQQKRTGPATETDPLLAVECPAPAPAEEADPVLPLRQLLTRPVCIALLTNGLLCFCDMGYAALAPLVCPKFSPRVQSTHNVRYTHRLLEWAALGSRKCNQPPCLISTQHLDVGHTTLDS